ncbi:hypothetical protein GQ602_005703 [Ophiocordyceps camponoti-floridani]|uniref:Uncharacterized protein n=1 Tax=Ophiocordyceps camponoti-floridani TaxID=2030778 RepID=A0A8H4Q474_9HYPO|nr:hypothetical protein GQ602_005703 [Ophiocordyceps camponoti-floridani]
MALLRELLLLLVCLTLASAFQKPHVYVLASSEQQRSSTTAITSALDTLGFRQRNATADETVDSVYSVITPDDANTYRHVTHARFILPSDSSSSSSSRIRGGGMEAGMYDVGEGPMTVDELRNLFDDRRLLELDVGRRASAEQAENWVRLCRFLGLGYSTVERMKLWYFPR